VSLKGKYELKRKNDRCSLHGYHRFLAMFSFVLASLARTASRAPSLDMLGSSDLSGHQVPFVWDIVVIFEPAHRGQWSYDTDWDGMRSECVHS